MRDVSPKGHLSVELSLGDMHGVLRQQALENERRLADMKQGTPKESAEAGM